MVWPSGNPARAGLQSENSIFRPKPGDEYGGEQRHVNPLRVLDFSAKLLRGTRVKPMNCHGPRLRRWMSGSPHAM